MSFSPIAIRFTCSPYEAVAALQAWSLAGRDLDWFHVVWHDPMELRIRYRGEPAPLETLHRIGSIRTGQYVPEPERFGGASGLLLAERLFVESSRSAVAALNTPGALASMTGVGAELLRAGLMGFCAEDPALLALAYAEGTEDGKPPRVVRAIREAAAALAGRIVPHLDAPLAPWARGYAERCRHSRGIRGRRSILHLSANRLGLPWYEEALVARALATAWRSP